MDPLNNDNVPAYEASASGAATGSTDESTAGSVPAEMQQNPRALANPPTLAIDINNIVTDKPRVFQLRRSPTILVPDENDLPLTALHFPYFSREPKPDNTETTHELELGEGSSEVSNGCSSSRTSPQPAGSSTSPYLTVRNDWTQPLENASTLSIEESTQETDVSLLPFPSVEHRS